MAQIKVNELSGSALDWAVLYVFTYRATGGKPILARDLMQSAIRNGMASPSTDWAQGGPIIELEAISTCWQGTTWVATLFNKNCGETWYGHHYGPTPLIAAMRCYVASKMGNVVEVPDELIK